MSFDVWLLAACGWVKVRSDVRLVDALIAKENLLQAGEIAEVRFHVALPDTSLLSRASQSN